MKGQLSSRWPDESDQKELPGIRRGSEIDGGGLRVLDGTESISILQYGVIIKGTTTWWRLSCAKLVVYFLLKCFRNSHHYRMFQFQFGTELNASLESI